MTQSAPWLSPSQLELDQILKPCVEDIINDEKDLSFQCLEMVSIIYHEIGEVPRPMLQQGILPLSRVSPHWKTYSQSNNLQLSSLSKSHILLQMKEDFHVIIPLFEPALDFQASKKKFDIVVGEGQEQSNH